MSRITYYMDEHISRAVIRGLQQRGVDVLSVPEADMLSASDDQHLAFALVEGRVVFTHDTDFLRLAAAGNPHAGIVYAHQRIPTGQIIRGLMLISQVLEAKDMIGKVEFL